MSDTINSNYMEKNMNNILIVDNGLSISRALEIKLQRSGFEPFVAHSKQDAYHLITEKFITFFGVIMEVDLDDTEDKLELVRFMTDRRIATIVLSSISNDTIIASMQTLNIIDFIQKEKEEDLNYAVDMMSRIKKYKDQKVLIVHESKDFLHYVKQNLEALMFNVLIAVNAEDANRVMSEHDDIRLALISSDLQGINGFELTLSFRKRFSKEDLIIVAIARVDDPASTSMFLKYGANGYVSNRCTRDELNYTISNLMDVLHNKEEAIKAKKQIEEYTTQLSKYISPQIYHSIITGKETGRTEARRKKLTIFFLHIVDFNDILESFESAELTYWLNQYLSRMSSTALKHGATIDKFIGDAIMIFFGAPESKGVAMDALNCVKMAIEMQAQMVELRKEQRKNGVLQPFYVKAGVSTGFVTVGNFGNADRMDYTIIGSFVNLAARLEHAAKAGEILIPEETYHLVRKHINVEKGEEVFAKGFPGKIQTYRVIGLKDEKELSDESNLTLRNVLSNIDRSKVELTQEVLELLTDISGINDHIRR